MSRRLPSVMQHNFSQVPQAEIPRSMFNRSCGCKTTFDSGYLIPVFVDEALPGDTFNLRMTAFSRLATPLYPLMDNLFMDSFFFAVPIRLIWSNWQKFNGEQVDPDDSTDFLVPTMTSPATTGYVNSSLSDYFGLPTGVPGIVHSSLWHRAYNLIWNEWFRDENLQDSVVVDKDDGPDNPADYVLKRRGKRHDYFTSCLPWPQKGPAVDLPLGAAVPVIGNGKAVGFTDGSVVYGLGVAPDQTFSTYSGNVNVSAGSNNSGATMNSGKAWALTSDPTKSNMVADLSQATAATINQLRQSFQIQKLLERDARGGTRYTEIIRSHFGVVSPDARLQRPEYLGGSSTPVNISPIAQTSATDESGSNTPQGNLAAMGTVLAKCRFNQSFTEHGMIIGLASIRADLTYQQGLRRMWSRKTRYDFYFPAFAHLGEQAVLSKEIYCDGLPADEDVFGYQERWAEYRYHPTMITGRFRSTAASTLDAWHLAQRFGNRPMLNNSFIEERPPIARVTAVNTDLTNEFIFDSFFNINAARPMPLYSVPGLIDHF